MLEIVLANGSRIELGPISEPLRGTPMSEEVRLFNEETYRADFPVAEEPPKV